VRSRLAAQVPAGGVHELAGLGDPVAGEDRDRVAESRPSALTLGRVGLPTPHTVEEKLEHVAAERGIVVLPESTAMFYTRTDVVYRYVTDLPLGEVALAFEARRSSVYLEALARTAAELFSRTAPVTRRAAARR